jgi:hypothetical protein
LNRLSSIITGVSVAGLIAGRRSKLHAHPVGASLSRAGTGVA